VKGSGDGESKDDKESTRHRARVLMSGLITALGIALHNFPGEAGGEGGHLLVSIGWCEGS
jgi:hypothetical protein